MRLLKESIPDEYYEKVYCDCCDKILAKFLRGEGFVIKEDFNTLCNDCFGQLK